MNYLFKLIIKTITLLGIITWLPRNSCRPLIAYHKFIYRGDVLLMTYQV